MLARGARGDGLMRGRGDRLEAELAKKGLDRMLVTDLTNVRYLDRLHRHQRGGDLQP